MTNSSLIKKLFFVFSIIFLVSCDTDYNEIGTNIVGSDLHNGLVRYEAPLTAYDRPTGPVQTNNLTLNSLGVYTNPVFGTTTASFVSQLELATVNPTIPDDAEIDSVWVYVPYYSTLESVDDEGVSNYSLDSVYGDLTSKFRLSIKRNGYFIRAGDATTGGSETQKYYSDQKSLFDDNQGESLLKDGVDNIEFEVSSEQIVRTAQYTDDDGVLQSADAEVLAPGMFLYLNKDFFQQWILEAPSGSLVNNNVFKNYFRGVYFKAEQIGGQSLMVTPKFSDGYITIIYHQNGTDTEGNVIVESKTITLNLAGEKVNLFENSYTTEYLSAIESSNTLDGDNRLFIKGGEGSVALIDLNQAGLDALREENIGQRVLINEANLTFYIDKTTMAGVREPFRVYLYDANNNTPLYDYYVDLTTIQNYPKYDRYVHGGIIETDAAGDGIRYKVRITNHINNIINKDSTNVKLGLAVTESIGLVGSGTLKNPFNETDAQGNNVLVKKAPSASVVHPFGTVLYGTGPDVPEDKRLKLEIFYTKPE